MSRTELLDLLHAGLIELGQTHDKFVEGLLIRYIELIAQWNRTYNLTAIRDLDAMVVRHLLDSLSIARLIKGESVLDVGTGAGLPGIPLAITQPHRQFVLLDSNQKKTRFLQQAAYSLKLKNIRVKHCRVEEFISPVGFDTVLCRAFSTLRDFLLASKHLVKPEGQFLAMKGVYPMIELQEVVSPFAVSGVHPLQVPQLHAERHVVEVTFAPQLESVSAPKLEKVVETADG